MNISKPTVRVNQNGSLTVSAIVDTQLEHRLYFGYDRHDAIKLFLLDHFADKASQ